jgi:hypothetical protein
MGGVDIADQLRGGMNGLRRIRRGGWRALWHFIFNLTLVNSFLLSGCKSQFEFRNALIRQLLEKSLGTGIGLASNSGSGTRKRKFSSLSGTDQAKANSNEQHQGHKLGYRGNQQYCTQCHTIPQNRQVLGEVSVSLANKKACRKSKRTQRRKKTTYGCVVCNIATCKEGNCFNSHVNTKAGGMEKYPFLLDIVPRDFS